MKVYIFNLYEEHGPENLRAALSKEKIRKIFIDDLSECLNKSSITTAQMLEAMSKLDKLLEDDSAVEAIDVLRGWGGPQLTIAELE